VSFASLSFARLPIALAALALGVVASCSGSRTEGLDASKLPENVRSDYDLFARRCSKCHSLARPLTSGISDDEQWVMYVNRMRRQPGSGISYEDQEHILRFLRYYAGELRRKAAEKKAPPAPSSSSSSPEPAPIAPPAVTPPPPAAPAPAPTTLRSPPDLKGEG
jgi:hypothetical protein